MKHLKLVLALCLMSFLIGNVSANFVCGEVISGEGYSANWMEVKVYYEEKISDTTTCQVSPEGKYCCDLEDIQTVKWEKGKTVFAEIFEVGAGFVSNQVQTVTTKDAYTLFPEIKIGKPIQIKNDFSQLLVEEYSLDFEVSIFEGFENFVVIIENSEGTEEVEICESCENVNFTLDFASGENRVSFIVSRDFDFVVNHSFFVLDYLNVNHNFVCEKCESENDYQYVPSNSEVEVILNVEASHPFEGELLEYVPLDWVVAENDSVADFSESHQLLKFYVNGSDNLEASYLVQTPRAFVQKEYVFRNEILGEVFETSARLDLWFWLGLPIYFEREFNNFHEYGILEEHYVSPSRPLVLFTNDVELLLMAIYPNVERFAIASVRIDKETLLDKERDLRIFTDLSNSEIEEILLQFKVDKESEFSLWDKKGQIDLDLYQEDENYSYYQVFLDRKDEVYLKS